MSLKVKSVKLCYLMMVVSLVVLLMPLAAKAESGAPGAGQTISIKLSAEPRLEAPILTMVGSIPQLYEISFPEAMNQGSVMKALQAQEMDPRARQAVGLKWDFTWETSKLLHARVTLTSTNSSEYSDYLGDYQLNVNGSKTESNQIIKGAPIFRVVIQNSNQLWRYAVDGSSRELLASIDEPYYLSKLKNDDRYFLAARYIEYCECDSTFETLDALYDVQEQQLIRYPVALQTTYKGKGDFVADPRGFFYEEPENGVTLPQSDTAATKIHIDGYIHGASFSKDGKHIFMAVGTKEQEKDLTILLYSLADKTSVVLAEALPGWVPESEVSSFKFPIKFEDMGNQVYFRLLEHEPYSELRYVYSWDDNQITISKPPFTIGDQIWAGFTASSDDAYRFYTNGELYHNDIKLTAPNKAFHWQDKWINGTHLLTTVGSEAVNIGANQYTSWISLLDADQVTSKKLYAGLHSGSSVIGSSLDGHSIFVSAPKPVINETIFPESFGKAKDKLQDAVTTQKNSSVTLYIHDQIWKSINPAVIDSNKELWIPMREILEATDWQVSWNAKERMLSGKKTGQSNQQFKLTLDSKVGVFNGKQENLSLAPKLIKGEGKLQGKVPSGFGRLFNGKGQLIYEGEFAEGKFHGQGQLYDTTGKLIYQGTFKQGKYSNQP